MSDKKDYRTNHNKGVELVVRPNNRYSAAGPGEHVLVDECELKNISTMSSCMTLEEARKFEQERKRKESEKAKPKRSAVQNAVEAGLDKLSKLGDSAIVAAKKKAERETKESEEIQRLEAHKRALEEVSR